MSALRGKADIRSAIDFSNIYHLIESRLLADIKELPPLPLLPGLLWPSTRARNCRITPRLPRGLILSP